MRDPRLHTSATSRRAVLGGLTAVLVAPVLAACSSTDPLAEQAGNADGKNYIAGDGSVLEISPEDRGEPIEFTSTTFDGTPVSTEDFAGSPVMLNFWYAACAPCRVEAPDLAALHEEFGDRVAFYGVNVRDTAGTAEAFERNFEITYPSLEERSGEVLLSLSDFVPPQAVPTTLVLDSQTRVAARILGIAERATLRSLIDTVATE
ncbi:TlpA family protein disulfide reductase [Auritidibacter ignavus]|uniref:TlpA family protein disulfide reductase n=1 Tax=Auritidibacter ignavus TaxID=678932 RepID=UPI00109C04EE|nr:TlpA disulfide reductase family protein [Auritidibacter ignavus]